MCIKSENCVQIEHILKKKKNANLTIRKSYLCPIRGGYCTDNTEVWRRGYTKSIYVYTLTFVMILLFIGDIRHVQNNRILCTRNLQCAYNIIYYVHIWEPPAGYWFRHPIGHCIFIACVYQSDQCTHALTRKSTIRSPSYHENTCTRLYVVNVCAYTFSRLHSRVLWCTMHYVYIVL